MSNSLYSLTWGDYGTSLVSAVQLLRCHGDLVDCTLAAGGRSFPAHKIVLCAASPYLLELLKNTPCKHPVVMLAGVNANDLEALLEFVYRGEVSVDHSQLPSLLQAAHCLNIQGLAPQTVTHKDEYTSIHLHPGLVPQHHVKAMINVGNDVSEELIIQAAPNTIQAQIIEETDPLTGQTELKDISQYLPQRKRKPRAKKNPLAKIIKPDPDNPEQQIIIKQEKGPDGQPIMKPKLKSVSEQPAACPVCNAIIRQSRNLKRHLELKHFSRVNGKKIKKADQIKSEPASTSSGMPMGHQMDQRMEIHDQMEEHIHEHLHEHIHEQHTSMEESEQIEQTTHVVTQQENTDGTTSLSIAQVMPGGHQLTIGNLNQATIIREDELESGIITTHEPTIRNTELYRTVYTIEDRRPDQNRLA